MTVTTGYFSVDRPRGLLGAPFDFSRIVVDGSAAENESALVRRGSEILARIRYGAAERLARSLECIAFPLPPSDVIPCVSRFERDCMIPDLLRKIYKPSPYHRYSRERILIVHFIEALSCVKFLLKFSF